MMEYELGGWFFCNEADGCCPECGEEPLEWWQIKPSPDLASLRSLIEASGGGDETCWQYAEGMARDHGCPAANGYPCQGRGDFADSDRVTTHCPAACWLSVARGLGEKEKGETDHAD